MSTIQVKKTCPECSRVQTIPVPAEEHAAWKAGELIQNALVSLTPAQREVLLTGYCHGCWDTLFTEEEEDYDAFLDPECPTCGDTEGCFW